jgi:hypothetical protein
MLRSLVPYVVLAQHEKKRDSIDIDFWGSIVGICKYVAESDGK